MISKACPKTSRSIQQTKTKSPTAWRRRVLPDRVREDTAVLTKKTTAIDVYLCATKVQQILEPDETTTDQRTSAQRSAPHSSNV